MMESIHPTSIKPDSVVESKVEMGSDPARLPSEYTPDDRIITELFVQGNGTFQGFQGIR